MTAIERDEMKISQAKISAVDCVQEWIQKLVNLGASPNEINDTLKQIKQRAIISLGQRNG
jgi:flagellar basal body P-ring protein FlgI